jgi:hypothetical protein
MCTKRIARRLEEMECRLEEELEQLEKVMEGFDTWDVFP